VSKPIKAHFKKWELNNPYNLRKNGKEGVQAKFFYEFAVIGEAFRKNSRWHN
jgi:hypothetical protein